MPICGSSPNLDRTISATTSTAQYTALPCREPCQCVQGADDTVEGNCDSEKDEDFKRIAAGLEDAIAFAKGDSKRGRIVAGLDVKAIRAKTKLSQAKFATKLRIPVATVSDWEQHRRMPDAPARTLLGIVDADPKAALALIAGWHERGALKQCTAAVIPAKPPKLPPSS